MVLTRKEQLLLYCLGRKTTVYEAAEAWTGKKGTDKSLNLGPWYTCKKELLNEKLIQEVKTKGKGRKVPITADLNVFRKFLFPSPEVERMYSFMFRKYVFHAFRKHIARVVDFVMMWENKTEDTFFSEYERSDILQIFTAVCLGSCDQEKIRERWNSTNIQKLYNNIMIMSQGDPDFSNFPKPQEWKQVRNWSLNSLTPAVQKFFTVSEKKELCVDNLFAKSKKRIERFMLLVYELMPSRAYKNYTLSQLRKNVNFEEND